MRTKLHVLMIVALTFVLYNITLETIKCNFVVYLLFFLLTNIESISPTATIFLCLFLRFQTFFSITMRIYLIKAMVQIRVYLWRISS